MQRTGTVESRTKLALKRLRGWRPLNSPATAAVRGIGSLRGRPIELAVKHLPRVGDVKATLPNGSTFVLRGEGDDWVSNQVYWRGWDGYEPETATIFYELATRARVIFDVGAHVGFYSLLAARANPKARIFAFEPMPVAIARLRRHLELNRVETVEVVEAAAAEHSGSADFFHPGFELPCSASLDRDFMDWHAGRTRIEVRTVALDEFAAARALHPVDLVKLDIETAEPRALRGMRETIANDRPEIICEVLPFPGVAEQLEAILEPLDYRYLHLGTEGPVERARIVPDPVASNYRFSPR